MGQRAKAMDTESPTSKFLYAIIKQIDLKIVDWNNVARDLGISNGHAARMRYSRFKGQIDPTKVKKKTPKKGEKGFSKADMTQMQPGMSMLLPPQMSFQLTNPGLVPKTEPVDPFYQPSPFVKCEPGHHVPGDGNPADGSERQRQLSRLMSSSGMVPPPYMAEYASNGLPFSMTSSLTGSTPMSNPSYGPYPMMHMSQDFHMDDFGMHSPFFNSAPVIAWEPTSVPPREHTPVASRSEATPPSVKEEPADAQDQIDVAAVPIKVEESDRKEVE